MYKPLRFSLRAARSILGFFSFPRSRVPALTEEVLDVVC